MPEFLKLVSPAEARALLLHSLPESIPEDELVDTMHAAGQVTAEDVRASQSLPSFSRSSMDGFAVLAKDTFGVSESLPGYLTIRGEVPMGAGPVFSIESGQAAIIHTGGMLPQNADAVVMLECTERTRKDEIAILRAVAPGENAILMGEDVQEGQIVIRCGTQIRPAETGGCMALGITQLRVAKKPKIGILSSGDEVIPPDQIPGQVRDVNSYSLAALVAEAGGEPVLFGIVEDKLEFLKNRAAKGLSECQLMIIAAGSSASARDMTAEAIDSLGAPGVFWSKVLLYETEDNYPNARLRYLPMLCMHCQVAPCLEACPTGATYRAEGGLILVDDDICIGCRYCIMACPYEARSYNTISPREYFSGKGLTEFEQVGYQQHPKFAIEKCTFCAPRLREGKLPACVATCPSSARIFGDLDDPESEVSKLVESGFAKPRLVDQGTKPSVFYIEIE